MTTTSPTRTPAPRGRPRDPALEDRVFRAAIDLFGKKGWAGFTIDGVARAAGVGKASLYLRWDSKQQLLFDALAARASVDVSVDTGDIRSDLRHLGGQLLGMFWADGGITYMRLVVEGAVHEEFAEHRDRVTHPTVLAARQIVHRATARGELPPGTSPALVLDAILGATIMHVAVTPAELRDVARERSDQYLDQLVDLILAGVRGVAKESGDH
ncbi:TetR/AcrR family transcriptional regulator [Cryptosporangium minutisporangium]|uniref:TetR/AcrR family transcriptional regulator n=1 Tax=Cryptosporangium minutisporangium TaxID=113569 RepID=UPI0031EBB885